MSKIIDLDGLKRFGDNVKEYIDKTSEVLEAACFETVEIDPSSNKFNPDVVTVETFAGTDYYVSEEIQCSIGDTIYARIRTGDALDKVSFGLYLVSTDETAVLVSLGAGYGEYTVVAHEAITELRGVKIVIAEARAPSGSSSIMVTINEEPTAFDEYREGSSQRVDRIEKNRADLQKQIDDLKDHEEEDDGGSDEGNVDISGLENRVADIESACFETVEVNPSSNKFNPDAAKIETLYGTETTLSDLIPCEDGDTIWVKYNNVSAGTFAGISFRMFYVDANGNKYHISVPWTSHVIDVSDANYTGTDFVGVRIGVYTSTVPAVDISNIMATVNEEPTAFEEYRDSESTKASVIAKLGEQVEDLQEQINELKEEPEDEPEQEITVAESRWKNKNVLVFGDSISTYDYDNYNKWTYYLQQAKGFNLYNYSHHACGYIRAINIWPQGDMPRQIEKAAAEFSTAKEYVITRNAQSTAGWGGAALEIYLNGATTATLSLTVKEGSQSAVNTMIFNTNDFLEFKWVKGTSDAECSFTISCDDVEVYRAETGSCAGYEDGQTVYVSEAGQEKVTPDLIVLFMGTNDFMVQTPIGAEGDGMAVNMNYMGSYLKPTHTIDGSDKTIDYTKNILGTFYGGVEHSMARIKELWPHTQVCVLTPMQRSNQAPTDGASLEEYRNVIVKTARRFAYPVKDLFTDANFAPSNPYDRYTKTLWVKSSQAYDGLHPNEEFGRDVLAPTIGAFIENMSSGVGYIDTSEKGAPGNDYVLTEADKTEIAEQAAALIDSSLLSILGDGVIV